MQNKGETLVENLDIEKVEIHWNPKPGLESLVSLQIKY